MASETPAPRAPVAKPEPQRIEEKLTPPSALLRIVASVEVGEMVQALEDAQAWKAYAAFVSRVVAIRDGGAS